MGHDGTTRDISPHVYPYGIVVHAEPIAVPIANDPMPRRALAVDAGSTEHHVDLNVKHRFPWFLLTHTHQRHAATMSFGIGTRHATEQSVAHFTRQPFPEFVIHMNTYTTRARRFHDPVRRSSLW